MYLVHIFRLIVILVTLLLGLLVELGYSENSMGLHIQQRLLQSQLFRNATYCD